MASGVSHCSRSTRRELRLLGFLLGLGTEPRGHPRPCTVALLSACLGSLAVRGLPTSVRPPSAAAQSPSRSSPSCSESLGSGGKRGHAQEWSQGACGRTACTGVARSWLACCRICLQRFLCEDGKQICGFQGSRDWALCKGC